MKELKVEGTNKLALVDDVDYDRLSVYKWFNTGTSDHLIRTKTIRRRTHNFILANEVMQTVNIRYDHIDRDGFNNQKSNLRPATRSQNGANKDKQKDTTSVFKGVNWHKRDKVFQSRATINGKLYHLGSFQSEIDAAISYNIFAVKNFQEFACLNKIPFTW